GYSNPTKTITASASDGASVTWSTSNSSVATVSNGTITAKSTGTAVITASTSSGASATCTVTVSNGSSTVSWSTSDSSVASVSSGTVNARGKGAATITASISSSIKATCSVKVGETNKAVALTSSSMYATFKWGNYGRGLFFYNSSSATTFEFTFITGSTAPSSGCLYQVYNSNNKNGGVIGFDSGKVFVTQYHSGNTSKKTSSYTLSANTKYTVTVTFNKGGLTGSIAVKDSNGTVLNTTSCSWSTTGADGSSSATIGPLSSILNGTAPNVYLQKVNIRGTNGQAGYGTNQTCQVDFSAGSIGATSFTSDKTTIAFKNTSVQYYVLFQ
ncbi:MAG: Ig-like domain-containing protein, partial [Clostridia bacterium]|nr:Ig-like domain-containing protein [Clostridia bacterium]